MSKLLRSGNPDWTPERSTSGTPGRKQTLRFRRRVLTFCYLLVQVVFVSVGAGTPDAFAQVADSTDRNRTGVPDTSRTVTGETIPMPDTSRILPGDTIPLPEPGALRPDSVMGAPPDTARSRLDKPVEFSSTDSLVIEFGDQNRDKATLYKDSKVTYGTAGLDAYSVEILFDINELRASGLPVDTGMVGRPQFRQEQESFSGSRLAYNMETERGRVIQAQTRLEDGFITGGVVKVTEDSTIYVQDGTYTTCNCVTDPSYSLRSNRMKVIDQEWIYTGPIQLFIFNIPTPLWLPFGFLPAQEGRRSGPLPPTYGEDERGFYLRNWGWYFAINDYMDFQVQGGLWTRGSWQITPTYRYNRLYRYNGTLALDYGHNKQGEKGDLDASVVNSISLRWSHSQTLSPSASFNSNVNLSTSSYLRTSDYYDDRVRQTIESTIRYNKQWRGAGRSLSLDLNQRQVISTREASLNIPTITFNQGSRKPFDRSESSGGRERWYEKITYSYNSTLYNRFTFTPLNEDTLVNRYGPDALKIDWYDALLSPSKYRMATGDRTPFDFRATHNLPVSANFAVNRLPFTNIPFRLNLSASASYLENWFTQSTRQSWDDSLGRAVTHEVPGFLAIRTFTTSLSANTTIYGIFPIKVGRFDGLRHRILPSLSYSYAPDYYSSFWGYTRSYTNAAGEEVRYPIASASIGRLQKAMSLQINNLFETRVADTDSTGEVTNRRTVRLLEANLNTSYNFAAPFNKMSEVSMNARTNIGQKFDLTARASFNPYHLVPGTNTISDDFLLNLRNFRFARMTQFNVTASTSLQSGSRGLSQPNRTLPSQTDPAMQVPGLAGSYYDPTDPFSPLYGNPTTRYADFDIPWSLKLDLSAGISKPYSVVTRRAVLNSSFDFNLTPKWKIQGRSGYDFSAGELVTTSLSIFRDLDCWEMSFSWVPFGKWQSYSFDLHVKSGKLRDLLRLQQPSSGVKGRFSGLLN